MENDGTMKREVATDHLDLPHTFEKLQGELTPGKTCKCGRAFYDELHSMPAVSTETAFDAGFPVERGS